MNLRTYLLELRYRRVARRFIATLAERTPRAANPVRDSWGGPQNGEGEGAAAVGAAWLLASSFRGDPAVDRLSDGGLQGAAHPGRRKFYVMAAATAAGLTTAAAIGLLMLSTHQSLATAVGEQRTVLLPDGSTLQLNSATSVTVDYGLRRRTVRLEAGEAVFHVAKSRTRPFDVLTSAGSARAVGTTFDVFVRPATTEVSIVEGTVAVATSDTRGNPSTALVGAGQQAVLRASGSLSIRVADLSRIVARSTERLEFDDVALGEALQEFNRYTAKPVRAETPGVSSVRISGVFHAGDSPTFAASISASMRLRAIDVGDAILLVRDTSPAMPD